MPSPSREDRRLMRQRGVGARELKTAAFGFTFGSSACHQQNKISSPRADDASSGPKLALDRAQRDASTNELAISPVQLSEPPYRNASQKAYASPSPIPSANHQSSESRELVKTIKHTEPKLSKGRPRKRAHRLSSKCLPEMQSTEASNAAVKRPKRTAAQLSRSVYVEPNPDSPIRERQPSQETDRRRHKHSCPKLAWSNPSSERPGEIGIYEEERGRQHHGEGTHISVPHSLQSDHQPCAKRKQTHDANSHGHRAKRRRSPLEVLEMSNKLAAEQCLDQAQTHAQAIRIEKSLKSEKRSGSEKRNPSSETSVPKTQNLGVQKQRTLPSDRTRQSPKRCITHIRPDGMVKQPMVKLPVSRTLSASDEELLASSGDEAKTSLRTGSSARPSQSNCSQYERIPERRRPKIKSTRERDDEIVRSSAIPIAQDSESSRPVSQGRGNQKASIERCRPRETLAKAKSNNSTSPPTIKHNIGRQSRKPTKDMDSDSDTPECSIHIHDQQNEQIRTAVDVAATSPLLEQTRTGSRRSSPTSKVKKHSLSQRFNIKTALDRKPQPVLKPPQSRKPLSNQNTNKVRFKSPAKSASKPPQKRPLQALPSRLFDDENDISDLMENDYLDHFPEPKIPQSLIAQRDGKLKFRL